MGFHVDDSFSRLVSGSRPILSQYFPWLGRDAGRGPGRERERVAFVCHCDANAWSSCPGQDKVEVGFRLMKIMTVWIMRK